MTKYEFDLFDMPSHDPYAPASRGVTRDYVRDLLNRAGSSGWKIVGSIDVHGVSELILMREVEGVAGSPCWVIEVDRFDELGYRRCSDEVYAASRYAEGQMWIRDADWVDPRKGDLFLIVDALERKEREENE